MNDERERPNEAHETPTNTRRNGRERVTSDDALSELAKIGAEDVRGVRVISAKVEERAAVHLTVDVKNRKSLSDLVEEVRKKAKGNIDDQRLPEGEATQVKVTVASIHPTGKGWSRVRGLWVKSMRFLKRELGPWIVPLLALGVGLVILWTITTFINETDTTVGDVVLVLLLVMPILIYAIISGKLTELKGPGGVEAKFTAAATTPVAGAASHDSVSYDELLTVDAGKGQEQLRKRLQRFTEIQPIVMTITIGAHDYGEGNDREHIQRLQTHVAQLSRSRNFAIVAFLDTTNNFVAYMPAWVIKNRLDDEAKAEELFGVIKEDDRQMLLEYPGIVRAKISPNVTNGEALRKMVESNLDVVVVVDENNRLKGVIEREQVLTKMVLALTPQS